MPVAKISSKNQIVIPKEAREALGVKPGDSVIVTPHGSGVFLLKQPKDYLKALRGIAKGLYEPDYLQKERQNWSRQDSLQTSKPTSASRSTPASSSITSKKTRATAHSPR
jgi:AbrB family looped-hinge helix DNA binding protein